MRLESSALICRNTLLSWFTPLHLQGTEVLKVFGSLLGA